MMDEGVDDRDTEDDNEEGEDRASHKGDANRDRHDSDGKPGWMNEGLEGSNDNDIFKSMISSPSPKDFPTTPSLEVYRFSATGQSTKGEHLLR